MSARVWHNRRFGKHWRSFASAVVDLETAETAEQTRDAEQRVRRADYLLHLAYEQRPRD